jgi:hypothetical protein
VKVPALIALPRLNVFLVLTENTLMVLIVKIVLKIAQNAQNHQLIAQYALVVIY